MFTMYVQTKTGQALHVNNPDGLQSFLAGITICGGIHTQNGIFIARDNIAFMAPLELMGEIATPSASLSVQLPRTPPVMNGTVIPFPGALQIQRDLGDETPIKPCNS